MELQGGTTDGAFTRAVFSVLILSLQTLNFLTFKSFHMHKNMYEIL